MFDKVTIPYDSVVEGKLYEVYQADIWEPAVINVLGDIQDVSEKFQGVGMIEKQLTDVIEADDGQGEHWSIHFAAVVDDEWPDPSPQISIPMRPNRGRYLFREAGDMVLYTDLYFTTLGREMLNGKHRILRGLVEGSGRGIQTLRGGQLLCSYWGCPGIGRHQMVIHEAA